MATTIRFARMGKKKRPFYRLVVIDSRKQRDGAYIANLGYYNPFVEPYETKLHADEIMAWLRRGASVSVTARSLLKNEGLLYRHTLEQQGLPADEVAARVSQWKSGADARAESAAQRKAARAVAARQAKAEAKAAKSAEAAAPADGEGADPAGDAPDQATADES